VDYFVAIVFLIFAIIYAYIARKKRKKGEWKSQTSSYKEVIISFLIFNSIFVIISVLIFIFSKSFELALGIGIFLLACSLSGFLRAMLSEKHIKDRLKTKNVGR
jgi:hypothetical protein